MSGSRSAEVRTAFCSACLAKTDHRLSRDLSVARSEYGCEGCGTTTVECFAFGCTHMAALPRSRDDVGSRWWCAEHNGDIASFANLEVKLADLAEWNDFFKRDSVNMAAATKTAVGALAGLGWVVHAYVREVDGYAVRKLRNAAAEELGAAGRR